MDLQDLLGRLFAPFEPEFVRTRAETSLQDGREHFGAVCDETTLETEFDGDAATPGRMSGVARGCTYHLPSPLPHVTFDNTRSSITGAFRYEYRIPQDELAAGQGYRITPQTVAEGQLQLVSLPVDNNFPTSEDAGEESASATMLTLIEVFEGDERLAQRGQVHFFHEATPTQNLIRPIVLTADCEPVTVTASGERDLDIHVTVALTATARGEANSAAVRGPGGQGTFRLGFTGVRVNRTLPFVFAPASRRMVRRAQTPS